MTLDRVARSGDGLERGLCAQVPGIGTLPRLVARNGGELFE